MIRSAFKGLIVGLVESSPENTENYIDLQDFKFVTGHMSATVLGYSNGNTTVQFSDGGSSTPVTLLLSGHYTRSEFEFAKDAGTGTLVDDPPVNPGTATIAGIAGSPINLALTDPSGVGALTTVTISGMPSDWQLNEGTNLGNGTWTIETDDLSALTVMTTGAYAGAMVLSVTESWANADGSTEIATIADNVEAYAPGAPIFALSGNDALTGTGGNDEFVFAQPIGNDTIYNFNVASDKIDLVGFAMSPASAIFRSAKTAAATRSLPSPPGK